MILIAFATRICPTSFFEEHYKLQQNCRIYPRLIGLRDESSLGLHVDRVRRVRVGVRDVRCVRRRARLMASLRVRVRVRAQVVTVLAVYALFILEVPQPLVVPLDLVA